MLSGVTGRARPLDEERATSGPVTTPAAARRLVALFVLPYLLLGLVWVLANLMYGRAWDPYPFILLNLALSFQAAYASPIIMMSQNRQDTRDRLRSELDYEVNRRAEIEIQGLANKLNHLNDKVADVEDMLRAKIS